MPLADAKGYVAATPESMLEVRWVSFARVPAGKLNPPDLEKISALTLERRFLGCDTNPKAVEIACSRVAGLDSPAKGAQNRQGNRA